MIHFSELPNPQRRAIELIREVAAEKNCRPFLVGGPVRDLLLGRNAFDVDLTLEDGSSTLARALAKRVEGRVRSFPQFLTYKVVAEDLPEVDIATARKERYRKPGALPSVTPGRLQDDLLRRDFSINAIAVDLLDGRMYDPTDGKKDLAARTIRVLHDQSFVDDPTRILRAIRLASRLSYSIEPHTAILLRYAIEGGALSTVSRERLWRELFLAMDEEDAPRVLLELETHGVLRPLFGSPLQSPSKETLEIIRNEVKSLPSLDRYVLYTGALLGETAVVAQLEGSGFSQKRARTVLQVARDVPRIEKTLAEARSDRQRFRLFKSVPAEVLSLLSGRDGGQREQVARFRDYQSFKIPLRGVDLEVPPGPHIARALERTRQAVFSGEIEVSDARAFARDIAIRYLDRGDGSGDQ